MTDTQLDEFGKQLKAGKATIHEAAGVLRECLMTLAYQMQELQNMIEADQKANREKMGVL